MFVFKAQPSWIWSIQTRDTNSEPIEDPRVALEQWFYADVHSVFFAKTALEGAKVEQNENIPLSLFPPISAVTKSIQQQWVWQQILITSEKRENITR